MSANEASLLLAMAASDAYENADANLEVIEAALDRLHDRVEIEDDEYAELIERLYDVLATNRTAPAVMRIMASADAARVAAGEATDPSHGRRARRQWRKESDRARGELLKQLASTLDNLARESY